MVIRIDRRRPSRGMLGGCRVPSIRSPITLLTLGLLVCAAPAFAEPENVGVAAEVNPDVTGKPPDEPLRELLIGHNIIRNEKITTQDAGQAQLLFTDQSTLTVARNSEVVIDEFVFDPKKQVGNLTAALTTGLFRYVGGKISKEKDIIFYTPTGTVSVRGGIALIKVHGNTLEAIFVFGQRMTVTINGQTQTATQPNTVIFTTNGRPSSPAPATVEMLESFSLELQSSSNQTLTIGNDFAAEAPDLPPNFIPTQAPAANPAPAATPAPAPSPTLQPAPTLAATPSAVATAPAQTPAPASTATPTQTQTPAPASTPTPTQTQAPAPPSTPTPAPTQAPGSTPTPPPATAPQTPPPHEHHKADRDHDHDDDVGDRHHHDRDVDERDPDDRDLHHDRDRRDARRLADESRGNRGHPADNSDIGAEPATHGDLEHQDHRDDSGDRHRRSSGEDRGHGNENHSEEHNGFDRYMISGDHNRDGQGSDRHGFDRHPVAGSEQGGSIEHDGDRSHRFSGQDGHRRARELLALNRFHDAIERSGRPHMPYWANGGRPYGHGRAGRHHIPAHR